MAETLLESLDLEQDYPIAQEWLEEIRRRSRRRWHLEPGAAQVSEGFYLGLPETGHHTLGLVRRP